MKPLKPRNAYVTQYWLQYYTEFHCTVCGNAGVIDSRGVKSPVGVPCGRLNWCFCPNGQELRATSGLEFPPSQPLTNGAKHDS